jgi:predicted porin
MEMNKYLLSSVMLTLSGLASAQSSVSLFGVVDVAVAHGSGSVADRTQLVSGGNSTSRIGFRGTERLGDGLSAGFWLEAGLSADSGAGNTTSTNNQSSGTGAALNGGQGLLFNRRSTVSLLGGWGEVRLGRDHSVQFKNRFEVDPFGNNGVGTIQPASGTLGGPVSSRVSNSMAYYLPDGMGGLYGHAQYYLGENASNAGATADDGTGGGVRVGYRAGALNVSVSAAKTKYAQTATTGDITSSSIGVQYRLGPVNLMAGYYVDEVATLAGLTGKGGTVGGIWLVGAGEVKAAFSNYGRDSGTRPETKKLSLGYEHNLSKRTALYATYARLRNSGGATAALNRSTTAANQSSSGFDLGLRHNF